ncbi:MAG: WD40 repeat domain-containing protein [Anaerolineales bacterium]
MTVSPDGNLLLVIGSVGLFLYDAQKLEMIWSLPTKAGVVSAAFSPDGKRIASIIGGGEVDVWNTSDGSHIWNAVPSQYGVTATWRGYDDRAGRMIVFSPDGRWVAAAVWHGMEVFLLDAANGEKTGPLEKKSDYMGVSALTFSPDGSRLVGADYSMGIYFWDVPSGELHASGIDHTIDTRSIVYSPDGKTLAYNLASSIAFLDIASQSVRMTTSEHDNYILELAYSPDGKSIASASLDDSIKFWNPADGSLTRTIHGHTDVVTGMGYGAEGTLLFSGSLDGSLVAWNPADGSRMTSVQEFQNPPISMGFSPDGKRLVAGSRDGKLIMWDTRTGHADYDLEGHSDDVKSIYFAPDGKSFASGSKDRTIIIWNAETGQKKATVKRDQGQVYAVAYSPDGKRLASGFHKNTLNFLDPTNGNVINFVHFGRLSETPRVKALAYSADGTRIMTLLEDNYHMVSAVEALDTTSRGLLHLVENDKFHSHAIAFSRDSRYFLICTDDHIDLWELETSHRIKTYSDIRCGYDTLVAISPDGNIAAANRGGCSADREEVFLWDAHSEGLLQTLPGHNAAINVLAFSPDGKTIASGSEDGTIILWNIEEFA